MEKIQNEHLYLVILCGGSGKRLWPHSRMKAPKQFIKLFGDKTIFQQTIERAKLFVPLERIYLITNSDYLDEIYDQAPEILSKNIFPEPEGKNTAMAMGMGAIFVQQQDPEGIIVNFPSDHHIADISKFEKTIRIAVETAQLGDYLITIGLKPTFPHGGLGYIKAGERFKLINDLYTYKVEKHIEKPEIEMAEKFLKQGGYYWNVNLYTYKVSSVLKAIKELDPELSLGLDKIRESLGKVGEMGVVREVYEQAKDIMFDYAISEKAHNLILVPGDFEWSDVGDWKVAYDVSPKDKDGNVVIHEKGDGEFISIDSKNCLIHFSDQLIAAIGVENLVIVDTKDALLIMKKDRSQEVKTLVNKLQDEGKLEYL